MKSRGEIRFISFPRFAAGLYSKLTQTPSLQQQYQEIAASLTGQVKGGRLLDIGTGPGRLLLEIHRMNPAVQLYGLDISQAMVKLARKNLAGVTTELNVANACATGFEDDFFDAVTCSGSFYLWDQPERGLDEIHRILKPGHRAYLFEVRRDHDHHAYRAALKNNLKREGLAMKLFGPFLLAQALRMAYRADEVTEIIARTSFVGGCRIENLALSDFRYGCTSS